MTELDNPREFSAAPGEPIHITVQSVNFVNNAILDDLLTVSQPDDFTKIGTMNMPNADTVFVVTFVFPNPLPAGGKYTFAVNGFGAHDVLQIGNETLEALPFKIRVAAAAASGARRR